MRLVHTDPIPTGYVAREREEAQAQRESDAKGEQIAATREITAAIRALPVWARTPAAYAQVCCVLSAEIQRSGWGHTDAGVSAQESLDDAADAMEYSE